MSGLTTISTDQWIPASWEDYQQAIATPALATATCYYFNHQLRLEMTPQGYDHSADNASIGFAVHLVSGVKGLPISGVVNCTFRKVGEVEVQPDLAFYLAENAEAIPPDTTLVDLTIYPPPDLVIEIAKTSLSDDLGNKRMLYERLGVKEYWVVDVRQAKIIAFTMSNGGSWQITQSELLPMLPFSLLEETLRRSRETGRGQLYSWLLNQIQNLR